MSAEGFLEGGGSHRLERKREHVAVSAVDAEYVARTEDVLNLYAEEADPKRPVVSFDESPTQLIGEVRKPIPAAPGRLKRFDSEYQRNGTANLFVFLDVHRPWRHIKVTDRRTAIDFAQIVRVVLDNLSTHKASALYQAFEPGEALRILRRLEFHYVPKHASWLNMVEIETGVLRCPCSGRRTFRSLHIDFPPPATPGLPGCSSCSLVEADFPRGLRAAASGHSARGAVPAARFPGVFDDACGCVSSGVPGEGEVEAFLKRFVPHPDPLLRGK